MKAAVYRLYGPPEVVQIQDIPKPVPRDNEILVRVAASTVCAADWRLRKADPFFIRLMMGLQKPKKVNVLGMEFAGVVESVGASVTRFRPGDQVFGGTGFRFGTHAEYVCVREDDTVAPSPSNMPLEDAAAVMFGGITALDFLRRAAIQPGWNVLVYGASGSVGIFAVQLAKHFGARVTGVCSTANLDLVRSLGADHTVDYTREDFSRAGHIYDVVFDTVGKSGFSRTMKCLKRGGKYVLVGGSGHISSILIGMLRARWVSLIGAASVIGGVARGAPGDQAYLKNLIEAGSLRTVIDRRYPFAQIAQAHAFAEAGHKKGHVLVVMD